MKVINYTAKLVKTKEYQEGLYIVQDKASCIIPHIVDEYGLIVDLTAGPGGKITHFAQYSSNVCIACDIDITRCYETLRNVNKLKLLHVVDTIQCDSTRSPLRLDKAKIIIVDPPCSNLGRICYDPEVRLLLTPNTIKHYSKLQKSLLNVACKKASKGSIIVYSTCTITQEECENVVNYILRINKDVEIVDVNLRVGTRSTILPRTIRLYPHTDETLGFFIAVLKKY